MKGIKTTETKIVTKEFILDEVHFTGGENGNLRATISFIVIDQDGKRVNTIANVYEGEEYNRVLKGFQKDGAKFLYQELNEDNELNTEIPADIEKTFINEAKVEPVENLETNPN